MNDPRYTDPRLNDPVLRDEAEMRSLWGWIAGFTLLALIALVVVVGRNSDRHAANINQPASMSTSSAPQRNAMPPSTTGSGTTSPQPPAPAQPGAQ